MNFKKELSSVADAVKKIMEAELSSKQKQIAKMAEPKNKIDAGDLAKLRSGHKPVKSEEVELTQDEAEMLASLTKEEMGEEIEQIDEISVPSHKGILGVRTHIGKYGTEYYKGEAEKDKKGFDDEDEPKPAKPKRGKYGARQNYVRSSRVNESFTNLLNVYKENGFKALENEFVKEEVIEEGRPSQRHPLEGHEYHKKTNAQLEYIAKDAHKAAEAMKSHNTAAENKYRDQANDSATVRYWRQKNGMPDWYKKKYGHIKEEVEKNSENRIVEEEKSDYSKFDMLIRAGLANKAQLARIHRILDKMTEERPQFNNADREIMRNLFNRMIDIISNNKQIFQKTRQAVREDLEAFHKKNMNEAVKDKFDIGEYDQEGDMAKSDLRSIIANAKQLHDMIEDADNLPEWCQNKITLAEDYISTVANYLTAEMNEEVEELDELSKSTLASYAKKASHAARMNMAMGKDFERHALKSRKPSYKAAAETWANKYKSDARKREAGVGKAIDRLAKEEVVAGLKKQGYKMHEEVELDEAISKSTHYATVHSSSKKIIAKGNKAEMMKKMKELNAKEKGSHHLGMTYRGKVGDTFGEETEYLEEKNEPTNPELWSRAKALARSKFDVYPSAYANGWAAKWYKSKGGKWKSVNEESKSEENPHLARMRALRELQRERAMQVAIDRLERQRVKLGRDIGVRRSAAAADLASSEKMKKPIKEAEMSKKAQIVKSVVKKKKETADTFQKDPIISKSEIKM